MLTISTSFILSAGLKKCSPAIRSGKEVLLAMERIERDEVFVAKSVSGELMRSSFSKSEALDFRSGASIKEVLGYRREKINNPATCGALAVAARNLVSNYRI